ncbi:hypothetical protein GQX73_g975 [Xylaria multiplex]|uniref:Uncharacterized protein n=1 Tax=Xylaria multiplex TaxID=323545 RepID=A0A7C8MSM8_9PEZI|nr:hypothetical protein GQX73_g975 [Xylaria multiplex]
MAGGDYSPTEPEIRVERPRSFVIRRWPPKTSVLKFPESLTEEEAALRQARWHIPPSDDIIEESRQMREEMEIEEEAKKFVMQKAKEANERLSDEELERRVRRMYERSSQYNLPATTYQRPPSPPQPRSAPVVTPPEDAHVRSGRHSRPTTVQQPADNMGIGLTESGMPIASSQALPSAATYESIGAPEASSTPAASPSSSTRQGRFFYYY